MTCDSACRSLSELDKQMPETQGWMLLPQGPSGTPLDLGSALGNISRVRGGLGQQKRGEEGRKLEEVTFSQVQPSTEHSRHKGQKQVVRTAQSRCKDQPSSK